MLISIILIIDLSACRASSAVRHWLIKATNDRTMMVQAPRAKGLG